MMELKDFVAQALAEIIQGVVDAQRSLGESGKHVNPQLATEQGEHHAQGRMVSIHGQLVQPVEFDVAVTATEGTGTKGGIGVVVGALALGSKGESKSETSAVSRIKFSIPITLPYGATMPGRR